VNEWMYAKQGESEKWKRNKKGETRRRSDDENKIRASS